jgi:hypothetical protein
VGPCDNDGPGREEEAARNTHGIFITNLYSRHHERQIRPGRRLRGRAHGRGVAGAVAVPARAVPAGSDTDVSQNFDVYDLGITAFLAAYFGGRLSVRGWQHRLAGGRVLQYSFVPPEVC